MRKRLTDLLEILFLTVPTLLKIFSNDSDSIAFASKASNYLNELILNEEKIALLQIKLHLFIIGVTISKRDEAKEIEQILNSEVEFIESRKREIRNDELASRIDFEIALARTRFFYKLQKGHYRTIAEDILFDGAPTPKVAYAKFLNIFESQCSKILKSLTSEYEFERSKAALFICETRLQNLEEFQVQEYWKETLLKAIQVFSKYHCAKLELRSHMCIAKICLG